MFQACISISACIFYVFMNIIHRVCVYKWAYCWVKKKKLPTYIPTLFFSTRYGNTTTIFFCLTRNMPEMRKLNQNKESKMANAPISPRYEENLIFHTQIYNFCFASNFFSFFNAFIIFVEVPKSLKTLFNIVEDRFKFFVKTLMSVLYNDVQKGQ